MLWTRAFVQEASGNPALSKHSLINLHVLGTSSKTSESLHGHLPGLGGVAGPMESFRVEAQGEGQFLASPEQPTRRAWARPLGQQFACHLPPTSWVRGGFYDICVTAHHFNTSLLNKLLLLLLLIQSHVRVPVQSEHWEDLLCLCEVLRFSGDSVTA